MLSATDMRFGGGRIGLGSFDDQGCFRKLRVRPLAQSSSTPTAQ